MFGKNNTNNPATTNSGRNKMKKVLITLLVLFAITGTIFAQGNTEKKMLMGVITPAADHGFTGESIKHCEAEVKALAAQHGFDYKIVSAGESAAQANGIDTILAMKPDAIMLWPVNGDELRSQAQSITDAGVPLIVYDRFITGFQPTAEISGDNVAIGVGAGHYFNNYFKDELAQGKVNYLEFKGDSSTVPMERTNGLLSVLDPNFNLVQSFVTNWSMQTSMEQMENYLNTKSVAEIESIKAIFTHDDEIVAGIVEALKNYKGPAKINIELISGVAAGEAFMGLFENSGLPGIDFMTYTFSPAMVRDAVDLTYDAMTGKQLEPSYKVPTNVVDKTNYKDYMASDIYKIRYSI